MRIEGGYIDRTVLKLFKGTHSWFDILGCSIYQGFKISKVKPQRYTRGVQGSR